MTRPLPLSALSGYKEALPAVGYPTDRMRFYSPVDNVHGALLALLRSASREIQIAMYGFDDDELLAVLQEKMKDENVSVQLVLDKTQAGGKHEKALLATYAAGAPMTSVVIGSSEKHRIMHMKLGVIDGILSFAGSTNWSSDGETKQDNELTIDADPYVAAEALMRINAIRLSMESARAV